MTIRLTEEQWANVVQGSETPVWVSDPAENAKFVPCPGRNLRAI